MGSVHVVLRLRCELAIENQLIFVELPVAEEIWNGGGEEVRRDLRDRARRELDHEVAAHLGEYVDPLLLASLPVYVEHPDYCTVECVGGSNDGRQIRVSGPYPPASLFLPVPSPIPAVADTPIRPRADVYQQLTDEQGFPLRGEDGTWRYGPAS